MADAVSTFKAVCRGGLNTGSDVLSLGQDASGAATQLINYEPNLEGGYRKINGYAHSFGTVTGTGSVLGVAVANGINQGILACRTPSSGNNYLHHWNFYYSFNNSGNEIMKIQDNGVLNLTGSLNLNCSGDLLNLKNDFNVLSNSSGLPQLVNTNVIDSRLFMMILNHSHKRRTTDS